MSKVLILLHPPECEICGEAVEAVEPKGLRQWNDREVCTYCINQLEEEFNHASNNHDQQRYCQ